jgi:hypothetical protein
MKRKGADFRRATECSDPDEVRKIGSYKSKLDYRLTSGAAALEMRAGSFYISDRSVSPERD